MVVRLCARWVGGCFGAEQAEETGDELPPLDTDGEEDPAVRSGTCEP